MSWLRTGFSNFLFLTSTEPFLLCGDFWFCPFLSYRIIKDSLIFHLPVFSLSKTRPALCQQPCHPSLTASFLLMALVSDLSCSLLLSP